MDRGNIGSYKMVGGLMLLFAVVAIVVTSSAVAGRIVSAGGVVTNSYQEQALTGSGPAIGTVVKSIPVFGALRDSRVTCVAPCVVVERAGRKYRVAGVAHEPEDGLQYGIVVLREDGGDGGGGQ